jgi:ribosomal protein S16
MRLISYRDVARRIATATTSQDRRDAELLLAFQEHVGTESPARRMRILLEELRSHLHSSAEATQRVNNLAKPWLTFQRVQTTI